MHLWQFKYHSSHSDSMRKVIIEIELYEATKAAQRPMFAHIHSYEVLEVLKVDHIQGLFVDLIECRLKEGVSIEELKFIGNMEVLSVIRSDGDKHTCLVKGQESKTTKERFKEEDLNLIYTAPSMISENRVIVSFISSQKDLKRFLELVRAKVGKVTNITFKKATYQKKDVLSVLTGKQREVITAAYKYGYYDVPRRTSSGQLSRKVKISRPTLLEHLRKAERRIIAEIMAGHPE
jgi:predicted DNA binding protein